MPEEKASQSKRGEPRVLPFLSPLLGAIIGAVAALTASYFTATYQGHQAEAATLLQQREGYYSAFLIDSNSYAQAALAIDDYELQGQSLKQVESEPDLLNSFRNARYKFRTDINDVYVYGTPAAWKAAKNVVSTLPDTHGQETDFRFTTDRYNHAYQEFLSQFCAEAQPGRDCPVGA